MLLNQIKFNSKNLLGWKTKRKLVAFSVDDYGNVRLASREAGEKIKASGLSSPSKFDQYDCLETRRDLEMLFEALSSVSDTSGNHAVFTLLTVPCNIDFEKMAENDFYDYHYELLPQTYEKLSSIDPKAYLGAWKLWKQGISEGLIVPQFHGREHFNLKVFEEKLKARDRILLTSLQNRSNAFVRESGYSTINYTASFQFWDFSENDLLKEIISDGLKCFEIVFGRNATEFNAPGGFENSILHKPLYDKGIKYLYTGRIRKEHQGFGNFKTSKNIFFTGKRNALGQIFIVKNCVFEPTEERGFDWINYTMKEVEAAFRWNRPAIISAHRVNFSGHIDEKNRELGINSLMKLLKRIINRWPDVEFMHTTKLLDCLEEENSR